MNKLIALLRNKPLYQAAGEGAAGAAPAPAEPPVVEGAAPPASLLGEGASAPEGGAAPNPPPVAEAVAPLTLADIAIPEGYTVPEEAMTSFLGLMNDPELSPAVRATKLVELQASVVQSIGESLAKEIETTWTETRNQWKKEAEALPELGGDKLPLTLSTIKKGLDSLKVDKSFYEALNLTGAGDHPAVIRVLHALTKNLVEGGPVSGQPTRAPLSQAERMFGNSTKE